MPEDIDSLIAKFVEMDKAKTTIMEDMVPPPSRRSAFTLTPHPDKDQLIMFGGEYFNGNKTFMFNDLFFYTIKQDRWIQVRSPGGPTPRSAHQAVALSQGGGQLWIFGGEFTSQSQSQFHHFKDLWVFHFKTKKWEKIHLKSNLKCIKIFSPGKAPCPRSACQMVPISDGRVLIYGGYSKQKLKRDVEKGVTHTDMHLLCPDKHDTTGLKWKWQSVKQAGVRPSPRCGFSLAPTGSDKAILFGGVYDELDEDEELEGVFYNDMYQLDLMKPTWHEVIVTGKKETAEKKKRRRKKKDGQEEESEDEEEEMEEKLENMTVDDKKEEVVVSDDGVFTVTMGPSSSSTDKRDEAAGGENSEVFMPPPRINAGMVVKKGILYLYGGIYEDGDKQLTLGDFYALDLSKLEDWQTIIPLNKEDLEWFESDSEDDDDDDEEGMDDDSEEDDDDDDDDGGMDTD
ncbi:kelch domain-containing protein 4-like [Penaeus indicus]|uniref:kelch domain-containing protein 4-like n=1 Tax=Penaeus indicus TaxID=29960 RepID=UPI00300C1252